MRYFREMPTNTKQMYGEIVYNSAHPLCRSYTLFKGRDMGFGVAQMRFDPLTKSCYWDAVDADIANDIYLNPGYPELFSKLANQSFTIYNVRKVMWLLRMKPIPTEYWEGDIQLGFK